MITNININMIYKYIKYINIKIGKLKYKNHNKK